MDAPFVDEWTEHSIMLERSMWNRLQESGFGISRPESLGALSTSRCAEIVR
jgi:hypothetical protein